MTFQQIRYVLAIAEYGSFNKAAESLMVSQPSLTNAVHDLEKQLRISLFIRSNRGVTLTNEGEEFVAKARDLSHHFEELESSYGSQGVRKKKFAVSTQHYSFAVKSFVDLVKRSDDRKYEFAIRETKTREVINDVSNLRSEIGILYLSKFNRKIITSMLNAKDLTFTKLIDCKAYVYLHKSHPLASKKGIKFSELKHYPCLSFEQGDESSFYFAEEILSTRDYERTIKANDRATMLNLMVGLHGYTLCSGIISEEINGDDYLAIPLIDKDAESTDLMEIGYIRKAGFAPTELGEMYVKALQEYLAGYTKRS